MKIRTARSIEEYISGFPDDRKAMLNELRETVRTAAPAAAEKISYGIPTFTLHGNLVHFAAYKKHIGFYPTSSGINAFQKELSVFRTSRGTVQFPVDRPLPLALIKKIVRFRVRENKRKSRDK